MATSAELQAASTGGPVLLRIEKHAGHGGADLVKATVEERTGILLEEEVQYLPGPDEVRRQMLEARSQKSGKKVGVANGR